MSAPSRKRGVSVLGSDHSPHNSKQAKIAAASTRRAITPPATTMLANTKPARPNIPFQTSATQAKTPAARSSPSTSAPSSPSPSSSSISASSDEDAGTTSSLDPAISSSPPPSSSSSGPSCSSPSSATSPTPSPTHPQPPGPTHLPTPQKPAIAPLASAPIFRSRLSSFLPALAAANRELEIERAAGRLGERDIENLGSEDEEGGKVYIEMELGLGVLEERRQGVESGEEGESKGDVGGGVGEEKDVLGKLLGRERRRRRERPGIEVVDAM